MKVIETSSYILQLFPVPATPYYALIDRKRPTSYLIQPLTAHLALSLTADSDDDSNQIEVVFAGHSIGQVSASNFSQLADFLLFWKQAAASIPGYDSMTLKDSATFPQTFPSFNTFESVGENDPGEFDANITKPNTFSEEGHLNKNLLKSITPLKYQFISTKVLNIRCITWNLHAEPLSKVNIEPLLGINQNPTVSFDLYFIAIQESDQLGPKNLYANQNTLKATRDYIIDTLGGPEKYQIVAKNQLLGILSLVVCATPLVPHLSDFYQNTTGTGLLGIWGNKGSALNSFYVGQDLSIGEKGTKITFLNCHLTHGEGSQGLERRRWELGEIQKKLKVTGLIGEKISDTEDLVKSQNEKNEPRDNANSEINSPSHAGENGNDCVQEPLLVENFDGDLKEKEECDDEFKNDNTIVSCNINNDGDKINDSDIKKNESELKEFKQPPKNTPNLLKEPNNTILPTHPAKSSNRKITFVLGDLNYRVSLEPSAICELAKQRDFTSILSADQLSVEKKQEKVLPLYSEGEIEFPPTYKYIPGTDNYDNSKITNFKYRSPSYTDRIFYRATENAESLNIPLSKTNTNDSNSRTSLESSSSSLLSTNSSLGLSKPSNFCKLNNYTSLTEYKLGDHKPVIADFEVNTSLIDFEKRQVTVQMLLREADDRENSSKPNIVIDPQEILVEDAIILKQVEASIGVEYKVNANSPDKVLNWEISLAPETMTQDEVVDQQLKEFQKEEKQGIDSNAAIVLNSDNDDDDGVFLKSVAPVPSKASSRSFYLSHLPHVSVPIQISPKSGVLPPGGKQYIKFKCTLPVTRGRQSSTVRVAVLRIVNTQDIFIPVEFMALPTCLGTSLDVLSRYTNGARAGNTNLLLESSTASMPKEIWSCVNYLWQNIDEVYGGKAQKIYEKIANISSFSYNPDQPLELYVPPDFNQINSGQLFFEVALQRAESSLKFQILEWLDTGVDFDTMVLKTADDMQDPDAPSYISYYRDSLEMVRTSGSGGWLSSRTKTLDENAQFADHQIKLIETYSSANRVQSAGDSHFNYGSLLQTDKSLVGIYSVAAQFLVLLQYLDGSIIPQEYLPLVAQGRGGALLILEKLPRVNVNVLLYVMSFLKLLLEKEEEMVCMREAAEERVKKLLKQETEQNQSTDDLKTVEVDGSTNDLRNMEKDELTESRPIDSSSPKSVFVSDLDPTTISDSAEYNIGSTNISTQEGFGKAQPRTEPDIAPNVAPNVESAFSRTSNSHDDTGRENGVGNNSMDNNGQDDSSRDGNETENKEETENCGFVPEISLDKKQTAKASDNEDKTGKATTVHAQPATRPLQQGSASPFSNVSETPIPLHVSSSLDSVGNSNDKIKLVINRERMLRRSRKLLEFMDPYILAKPAVGSKESKPQKDQRLEFMLELIGAYEQ